MAICMRSRPDVVIGCGGITQRRYASQDVLNLGAASLATRGGRDMPPSWDDSPSIMLGELHKLELRAKVRPRNTASIHVLEKIGMSRVGTLDDVPGEALSLVFWVQNHFDDDR